MKASQSDPEDGQSTARRLLAVAAARFRAKGYAETSTRELAALLGIQNASLYHYIGKKEDLLYSLCVDGLERIHAIVLEAVQSESDPLARLRALIRTHLVTALADRDKHVTMLLELRSLSEARRGEVIELRDRYERLVQQLIAEGQAAGLIRNDIHARYLVLGLLNLLNWTIVWYRPGGELSAEQLAALMATLFLEGTLTRARSHEA